MKKGKKVIIIIGICVITFVIVTICFSLFIKNITPKTYNTAKNECEKILKLYEFQMEEIAVSSLNSEKNFSGVFKEYDYLCYKKEGFVAFDIDSQGMLGGQYWQLIYTQDGTLYGENESYFYEEVNGNNIIKAEKLNDHWWYLWIDYDGREKS